MSPIETLHAGAYKLGIWLSNLQGRPRENDWRFQESWSHGTIFRVFDVYYDGHTVPAIYSGKNPALYVHAHFMPKVFNALAPVLVRV